MRAGFDGVWLDKVDSALEDVATNEPTAKADMIAFVTALDNAAARSATGFFVVPQNGEQLLADAPVAALVDGFGKESLISAKTAPTYRTQNA